MTRNRFAILSASAIVALLIFGLNIPLTQASRERLKLTPTPGSLTPNASGKLSFSLAGGVFLRMRRPPRSPLLPYTTALLICALHEDPIAKACARRQHRE